MKLNRTELKKVMYDFNSVANRLMRVDFKEYNSVLNKFLSYIDNTEVISEYIADCIMPDLDVKTDVEEVANSYGELIFSLGDSTTAEISNIYQILKYISKNNLAIHGGIAIGYTFSDKYQDKVRAFNERVVLVLIHHIEGYLTKIGIDMGLDESIRYSITVNNGQVNLATDNSTINAVQNNGIDTAQLEKLLSNVIKAATSELSSQDREQIDEGIEVIRDELKQSKPRKSFLKTAIAGLQAVKGSAEFAATVTTLYKFVLPYLG